MNSPSRSVSPEARRVLMNGSSVDASLKVAVVAACPFPYPRGTPIRIERLSNAIAERGHEVHVFTYHLGNESRGDAIAIHRIPRVPTYKKVAPGPSYQKLLIVDPMLTAKVFRGLIRHRFDVIHAHHFEGLLVAKAAKVGRRIPLIFDAHNLLGAELPFFKLGLPRSFGERLGRRLDMWLPGLADHVVAVSAPLKDTLLGYGFQDERVTAISNGVEHELFRPDPALGDNGRDPSTLIFTGNLASYQGVEYLLRSLKRVVERRADARLKIVTDSTFDPYEHLARELGVRDRIDVVDAPFDEQPGLLARATVAVNPRLECAGIPQKLLNYMAAECPTVSFVGSAPCIEHAKTGWTVRGGDTDAFADGVLELLEDPALARTLGRQARESVLANYTWEVAAERVEGVYRRVVGARR